MRHAHTTELTAPDGKIILIHSDRGAGEALDAGVTRIEYSPDWIHAYSDDRLILLLPTARLLYIRIADVE